MKLFSVFMVWMQALWSTLQGPLPKAVPQQGGATGAPVPVRV